MADSVARRLRGLAEDAAFRLGRRVLGMGLAEGRLVRLLKAEFNGARYQKLRRLSNFEQFPFRLETYLSVVVIVGILWSEAMLRIGFEDCPYCHRADVHISRPKSLGEEIVILLLLQPVRCHDCMRRFLRPLFVHTPLPHATVSSRSPVQQAAASETIEQLRDLPRPQISTTL